MNNSTRNVVGSTTNSATERLRALLDERGVEHQDGYDTTEWDVGSIHYLANDHLRLNGRIVLRRTCTPEQAIDATLGPGTCRMEHLWSDDIDGVCWWCKACDKPAFTHGDFRPNYCPNCGRAVVE